MFYFNQHHKLPSDNINKEPLNHLEKNAKSQDNLEQSINAKNYFQLKRRFK